MEEALRRAVAEAGAQPPAAPFELHVHQGRALGVQLEVAVDSSAELLDSMERGLGVDQRR